MKLRWTPFIIALLSGLVSTAAGTSPEKESPESIFLARLRELDARFGDHPVLPLDARRTFRDAPRQAIRDRYENGLPRSLTRLCKRLRTFVDPIPGLARDRALSALVDSQPPLTAKAVYDYFAGRIARGRFAPRDGDVVCILPKSWKAFQYAGVIESPFEHADLVHIAPDGTPVVLELTRAFDLTMVPLADYLLGALVPNTRFAVYRYREPIDEKRMARLLAAVRENRRNLYYDRKFFRDTGIGEPARFFERPRFYYCMELAYAVYEEVLGHRDFDVRPPRPLTRYIQNRGAPVPPDIAAMLPAVERFEREREQFVIVPEHFTESPSFERVAAMGGAVPVSEMLRKPVPPVSGGKALAAEDGKSYTAGVEQ
jgi:hypothetical protein